MGQPDQPSAPVPPGRGKLKWAVIGGAAFFALFVTAIVAVYFLVPGVRASKPENTARFFPEDTFVYGWVTFSPGIGQGRQMLDIWNRFEEIPAFRDTVDDLLEEFEEETGIDFKEEVLPWIGPDLSFALLDVEESSPNATMLIGVRDHGAASQFLRDLLEFLNDGYLFEEDEADGFEVWTDKDSNLTLALSTDWFLLTTGEDVLNRMLDLMSGNEGQSLADNPNFQEARSAMQGDRAMSAYVDLETAADLSDISGLGGDILSGVTGADLTPGADAASLFNTRDWLAISARFIERGIVFEAVTPHGSAFIDGFAVVGKPAKLLPDDTVLFASASFEPNVDEWRTELESYTLSDLVDTNDAEGAIEDLTGMSVDDPDGELSLDSTLADVLDYVIDIVDESIGIDLEKDLLDLLGGQAIVALRDFDFERVGDTEGYAVDAVAMMSYVDGAEEGLMDTMDKLLELIEESGGGLPARTAKDIGADHEAVMFDVEDIVGATAYSPGYVLHDGYMTIGSTERALRLIVDAQNGRIGTLDADREFQRARERLPDVLQAVMFINLQRIIAQLHPDRTGMDPDVYEVLEKGFAAVAGWASVDADYSRTSFALTLFPE